MWVRKSRKESSERSIIKVNKFGIDDVYDAM